MEWMALLPVAVGLQGAIVAPGALVEIVRRQRRKAQEQGKGQSYRLALFLTPKLHFATKGWPFCRKRSAARTSRKCKTSVL